MEKIIIGSIAKPQGIKGELKVNPITKDISRFEKLTEIYLGKEKTKRAVCGCKITNGNVFIYLQGIITRNDAELIRGFDLSIDKEDAVELTEGEYFISDITNCRIYDEENNLLGTVKNIIKNGAADIFEVKGEEKDFMFPFVKGLTADIDIKNKKIKVFKDRLQEVICYED